MAAETVRLPLHEMRLMRLFVRAEVWAWSRRFGNAGRLRVWCVGLPAVVAALWRILDRGEALGLPASAVRRAIYAELAALDAEGDHV